MCHSPLLFFVEPSAEVISRDFLQISARIAPQHIALAQKTFKHIPPTRWKLEWYLPWWLGEVFGLDETSARQFVLSNVLGLAAIRLYDDCADDEIAPHIQRAATELARTLQHAALEIYRAQFPSHAPFWSQVESYLHAWRAATARVNSFTLTDLNDLRDLTNENTRAIAQLGAPLKISALAICQLTAREKNFPLLEPLLDHALLANVLYDHAMDCDADLRGGRWNFFVATLSPLPQNRAHEQAHRMCLARAWTMKEMPRVYFQEIHFHIARAAALSCTLAVPRLQNYFQELHNSIEQSYARVAQHYAENVTRVTQQLFGKIYSDASTSTEHST